MRHLCFLTVVVLLAARASHAGPPQKPIATGLNKPSSVAAAADGRIFVALPGDAGEDGDGAIVVVSGGKITPFATGLDQPSSIAAFQGILFVADKQRIWRITPKGKADVFVALDAFPEPPTTLADLVVDPESATLYASDAGGSIYRVNPKGKVTVVTDVKRAAELKRPAGLALDGASHLLVTDAANGTLYRVRIADGKPQKIADGLGQAASLAWDRHGRLFIGDTGGRLFVIARPGDKPLLLADGLQSVGDICLDTSGKNLLVPDTKAGTITAVPARVPGAEVDERPLAVETAAAFPKLQWTGWMPETKAGKQVPLRPIVLTHAGDDSNRVFVATQHGVIHVFPNDPKADKSAVFLDIQDRVRYNDPENEEGFLGLAFHPQFRKNGEFFVFYTAKKAKHKNTNIVARFRVSKDDPARADPDSEEEILRLERPFWNHDGGTLCFGPDGFLYVAVGDGGAGGDPFNNGQNLNSLLGRILRIDIDRKNDGKNYAVPRDNPFVGREKARPETWAYGLRNVWRMAFDRKTGKLWAGDVGQNLYEEINIIVKGGNYGWKLREGLHPFGPTGSGPRPDLIDPIWEYYHSVGVCIIGGGVYRGARLPELDGAYVYADFATGKIWALRYSESAKRVTENRPLRTQGLPVLSFGEDERGEMCFLTTTLSGKGIFQFQRAAP